MSKEKLHKIIDFCLDNLSKKSFTGALQTYKAKVLSPGNLSSPCQFSYVIPPTICKPLKRHSLNSNAQEEINILSASAALAVMDDLSAYAIMVADRKFRPGVSVSLSAEILHPITAGQEVVASFQVDKIGTYLGFQTMELLHVESKQVLARGKHIKFMPMGYMYETLASQNALSRVVDIRDKYKDSYIFSKLIDRIIKHEGPIVSVIQPGEENSVGAVYRGLGVQTISGNVDGHTVQLKKGMNMIVGQMHGGAASMCVEEAATQKLKALLPNQSSDDLFLKSMQLSYLSGLKGNLRIVCKPSSACTIMGSDVEEGREMTIEGGIYSSKSSVDVNPFVQFTCEWTKFRPNDKTNDKIRT